MAGQAPYGNKRRIEGKQMYVDASELWIRHRPQKFEDVVGQDSAVKMLQGYLKKDKIPHAILFCGSSGIGKSTIAHIMAKEMGCYGMDLCVVNCATVDKPKEVITSLQDQAKLSPSANSKCRVWILEEIQSMSRATFARQAMLLMLESASKSTKNSYFFACSTDPGKLKKEILSRFKKIELKSFDSESTKELLLSIAKKEGRTLPESVIRKIIDVSGQSAREAVNQLDSAFTAGDSEEEMLSVITEDKPEDKAWQLKKALFWQKPKWGDICEVIKDIPREDREEFRRQVLKISAGAMLKNDKFSERAAFVVDVFMDSWEYCPESGLEYACWRVYREFGK